MISKKQKVIQKRKKTVLNIVFWILCQLGDKKSSTCRFIWLILHKKVIYKINNINIKNNSVTLRLMKRFLVYTKIGNKLNNNKLCK